MPKREDLVRRAFEEFEEGLDTEELDRVRELFAHARDEFNRLFGTADAIGKLEPDDFLGFFNLIDAHARRTGLGIFRFNLPFPKNHATRSYQFLSEDMEGLRVALTTLLNDAAPLTDRIDSLLEGPRVRNYITNAMAVPSVLLSFADPDAHAGVQRMDRKRAKLVATGALPSLPEGSSLGEEFVALEEALATLPAQYGREWDWATRFAFYFSDAFIETLETEAMSSDSDARETLADDVARKIYEDLVRHFNVLIYGPPGTGKTRLMQRVAEIFASEGASSDSGEYQILTHEEHQPIVSSSKGDAKVGWATFHQSYSYEEFIVGLRPDPESEQLLSLSPVPGLLLELAEFARLPANASLLVIDEINRGNVSRIFGEFITLMEPDKRLNDLGAATRSTVAVSLPYMRSGTEVTVQLNDDTLVVPNPFTMPRRLYTLASMNSVDKSVAPLDSALRRRFHVVFLEPDVDLMARFMRIEQSTDFDQLKLPNPLQSVEEVRLLALAVLERLNHGIAVFLGDEFRLGHWYLRDLADSIDSVDVALNRLTEIWEFSVLPQLEELFHGRVEQLKAAIRLKGYGGVSPLRIVDPEEELADLGGVPYLRHERADLETTIPFLRHLSGMAATDQLPQPANPSEPEPSAQNPDS